MLHSVQLWLTFTTVSGNWVKPILQGRNILQKEKNLKLSSEQVSVLIKKKPSSVKELILIQILHT